MEGCTLVISSPPGETTGIWDLSSIEGFNGIGTADAPFKGTLKCYYALNAGVQVKLDQPMIAYMGEGAVLEQLDLVCDGSNAAIAENISGNVTIKNIKIEGSIESVSGNAGTIAASVNANSTVSVSSLLASVTVTGKNAGGLAGSIEDNVCFQIADDVAIGRESAPITVTGFEASGGYFGTVTGSSTWDLADCNNIVAEVRGNDGSYAGGYAGKLEAISDTATLEVINGNSVKVNVSGTGNSGGLIGLCGNHTKIVVPDGNFEINGTVTGSNGSCGGVAGELINAQMELKNYRIDALVSGRTAGGIAGRIQGGKYIIGDVKIQNQVNGSFVAGGLVGELLSAAALELQGTSTVVNPPTGAGINGLVIGKQDKCLVYLSEIEGKIAGDSQLQLPADTALEEIGTYGGIYRNQQVTAGKLIGDGTLANVGVITHSVTLANTGYLLNGVADFQCLAILLGTDGNFAASAFPGKSFTELLGATYLVTDSVDISYDKTGIVSLNRNDVEDGAHAFCGKLKGNGADIVITQNSKVRQERVGLFSTLGGNAEFADLVIRGTVENAKGTGGIAYQTLGSGISLANITMEKSFVNNQGDIGGVLAKEINESESFSLTANNITLAAIIEGGAENDKYSGFITELNNANVNINTVRLGGSLRGTATQADAVSVAPGGFMGRTWKSVWGQVTDLAVLNTATYSAESVFGGMWLQLTNAPGEYMVLNNIRLNNLVVNANSSQSHCGLLVQDAKNLVLEVTDYDSTGCVVNDPGPYFDEIAGRSKDDISLTSKTGIISLGSSSGTFPAYHYENKVESLKNITNPGTMYFYDVFKVLDQTGGRVQIGNDLRLDSVEKVLLWDVVHYANSGNVTSVFQKYFETGSIPSLNGEAYTFANSLDLSKISFYPVISAQGAYKGENALITFGAKTNSVDMGGWQLSNEAENSQHYGLQAGLFYEPGEISVNDLTLSGEIADLKEKSGGLICGEQGVNKNCNISNIRLQDLWIADYTDGQAGLLISSIPANNAEVITVNLKGITMNGYDGNQTDKAAAALIGSAGGDNVDNLILNFSEMVIADDRDDRTDAVHNGKVLKYASFLYNYNYTSNAMVNEGHGLYLFSEADNTAGKVTYGEELDMDTEFADNDKLVFDASDSVPSTVYKPYVYQIKKIEVNPKSGDILKGCGTYEDPYIIESEKQFLTLYRYMNETGTEGDYQYQAFYQGWKVVVPGDDSTFCNTKHNVSFSSETGAFGGDGADAARIFGQEGFPTPDDMSRAYYRLGNHIDLSKSMSTTYKQIADDFVGFGTKTRPFVGVWYGKASDGTIYSVTLPDKTDGQEYSAYGFIQYAMGAVVKDMEIKTSGGGTGSILDAEHLSVTVKVEGMGGGVIACILGGDNIIDHVKITSDYISGQTNACMGGYVGNLKKGGLILRNVSEDALAKFRTNKNELNMLGAIVGKVEDGYIICEGSGDVSSYLWDGTGGNEALEQCRYYHVLNGDKLKADAGSMQITKADDQITFTIPNAASLQVLAMAMNADALNIVPSTDENYVGGYTENARCRKAAYCDIGCSDPATADYIKAAKYDNVMKYDGNANFAYAYPYLYQYMGMVQEDYIQFFDGGYSILNPGKAINGTAYHIQWNLVENTHYDMSQFEAAFRGIGALYQTGNGFGGTFRADFDGKNSKIKYDLERNPYSGDAGKLSSDPTNNATYYHAGLFNSFMVKDPALYSRERSYVSSFETENSSHYHKCFVIKDVQIDARILAKGSKGLGCAGGIVGYIASGNYVFENIVSDSINIIGESDNKEIYYIGGVIGYVDKNNYTLLDHCNFTGTGEQMLQLKQARSAAGGLVGGSKAPRIKIISSKVSYADISTIWWPGWAEGSTGGLIGRQNLSGTNVIIEGTENQKSGVTHSTITGYKDAGGLIGNCYSNYLYLFEAEAAENRVSAYRDVGGMAGCLDVNQAAKFYNISVQNVTVEETEMYSGEVTGLGGIVGYSDVAVIFEIKNALVSGTKNGEVYQGKVGNNYNKTRTGPCGMGGIVGSNVNSLLLTDCKVSGILVETDIISDKTGVNIGAGGFVGYTSKPLSLKGASVAENLLVRAPMAGEANTEIASAGGMFGLVVEGGEILVDDTVNTGDIRINNTTVSGKYAGGMTGYVHNGDTIENGNTKVALKGIMIENGQVLSDQSAGGVFGFVNPGANGVTIDSLTSEISNMLISGENAGGIIGEAAIKGPLNLQEIDLRNNTIVGKQAKVENSYCAGGLFGKGYARGASGKATFYNLTVDNNRIYCEVQGTELTENEIDHFAVGGLIGLICKEDGATDAKCSMEMDNIQIESTNQIGVKKAATEGNTQLIAKNGESYQLADVVLPTPGGDIQRDYDALSYLEEKYGYFVGSVIGVADADNVQLYLLKTQEATGVFVNPVLENNPPVTDGGRFTQMSVDDYRKYCHIIYGAPIGEANLAQSNLAHMKTQVDQLNASYQGNDRGALLTKYRLSKEQAALFDRSYYTTYTFPGTDKVIDFPILVYKAENGNLQEVLEQFTNIMTNAAGASASDLDQNYLTITCKPKICNGVQITEGAAGTQSITASLQNGQVTYASNRYDGLREEGLSFTEMTFTYGWEGHEKTFVLNVFSEEPILYSVHTKLMEGRITDVDTIREKGISETNHSIIMANDSDYTMLLEYTFGKARKNMPEGVCVDKVFYLQATNALKPIPKGTRLLLVDVLNGNKAYYYTVNEENLTQVKFTDFTDNQGKHYVNQDINEIPDIVEEGETYTDLGGHQLTEVGVERYLLTVLNADKTDSVYSIHSGLQFLDENFASRFMLEENHKEDVEIPVIVVPGLEISLDKTDSKTDVFGEISKNGTLTVKATMKLEAADIYWTEKGKLENGGSMIDSSNNGKYLELAFYLRDVGENRVRLPEGTNFSYKLPDGTYSEKKVIADDSLVYYYKDIRNLYQKNNFDYQISEITGNTSVPVEFQLDFGGADLSNITQESYYAWIDLLRTSNRDYPMGNGNKLDSYSESVNANASQEFGFAVKADDLSTLAINTYPTADTNEIPYHIMFDFSEMLKNTSGVGRDMILEKWSDYEYMVTYQLYQKNQNGVYEEYTGEDIRISVGDNLSVAGALTMAYTFSEDDIENGIGEAATEGVLAFAGNMKLQTNQLVADKKNLTNYKLQATLIVREKEQNDADESRIQRTKDFFIFTVTKLKTDL